MHRHTFIGSGFRTEDDRRLQEMRTSLMAHILAMEPILFVIVASVARARSSLVANFLRQAQFILPNDDATVSARRSNFG